SVTKAHRPDAGEVPASYPSMFVFGLKSLLGSVPPVESFRIDQALVGAFFTPSVLGLYVVAFGYTNLPGFIAKGIGGIAYPHVAENRSFRSVWRFFFLSLLISAPLAVVFASLASFLLPLLFGESFNRAIPLVGILFIENVLTSGRRVLSDGMRGVGAPGAGTVSELAYLVLLVILVPVMTPLGVRGFVAAMAVAAAGSLILMIMLTLRQSRRTKNA
ncbi:MAG TPA: oligosaccharide flippase family protein, partial [Actinomycetota bacterium]